MLRIGGERSVGLQRMCFRPSRALPMKTDGCGNSPADFLQRSLFGTGFSPGLGTLSWSTGPSSARMKWRE
ncbi:hypothetical protein XAC3810_400033 [Xanthomonas citri pv. citri]|uniref:Uncharacterized protein n=1 Tax=Xanthomonas citri pv. citri TaxID=611301 RepID=A0A0U5BUA2_XANCI|nr:hypothetical protein XAC9322_420034 [Xanthomonas citri pv. citri]CEE26615.1 hypothetical protein XAC3824_470019 [Xanthomonas citri pv. citri]CEE28119.1 hypothetical protein XAC1083_420034 [Xanthomonas citri pv. citri]CEE37300.1 hypothetical protein XAC3810_400033 [Xanthomonas citri pv. citri]CEE40051.1 hypothetical protein XAC2911_390029 [Xanthomonas citri pv. citri]